MATRFTRTTKPAAAKTVIEDAKIINDAEHTEAAHEAFENEGNAAWAKFKAAAEEYVEAAKLCSPRRALVAWLVGLLGAAGTGFIIGSLASVILNAIFVAIVVTTTSLFLAWLVYSIGVILTLVAAWHAGGYVGEALSKYVAQDKLSQHLAEGKRWVTGLFASSKPIAAR